MLKRSDQAGDTIVEVLIVIAIISLVLVGAYASTNKNIASTQDAQERTQAVKLVQTQIEYLRYAGSIDTGSKQCFSALNTPASGPVCTITPNGSNTQPAYAIKITGSGPYTISASWDSLVSNATPDNVTMYYQP